MSAHFPIVPHARFFSHRDAWRVHQAALRASRDTEVIDLDLSQVEDATTSAFARLVLLRRELRRKGRDLRLIGLNSRTARLYELNRLDTVLPRR